MATYKELDEVRSPETVSEANIVAGEYGVVLLVFEEPKPALLVEYADSDGQTKALVTYSPDLREVFSVDTLLAED